MNLNLRSFLTITATVASLALSPSAYAGQTSIHAYGPVHAMFGAMFGKTKMIKLSLRNDSSSVMELKVGDDVMKLDAGKSIALSLPVGTRILANVATATHPAGSLIEEVTSGLSGVTIGIR